MIIPGGGGDNLGVAKVLCFNACWHQPAVLVIVTEFAISSVAEGKYCAVLRLEQCVNNASGRCEHPRAGRVTFSNFLGHSTALIQFEVEGAFALYFWPTYFFLGCFFSSEVVVSPEFSMFYGIVYRNQVISTL